MSGFNLIEPATGEPFATIPRATADDADAAIRRAAAAFPKWRAVNSRSRGRILMRLSQLIRDNADELAKLESRNVGKPIRDSRDEVALAANCFEYYAGTTNKI
ncbi:MAG TPA: aldehyde dehydrogenase family protein, partial [Thermoanaerobaculia bacterium]|nr:aldehyde dehydrogenase family protein [Thermoanaerobaculia bacterium]